MDALGVYLYYLQQLMSWVINTFYCNLQKLIGWVFNTCYSNKEKLPLRDHVCESLFGTDGC